VSDAPATLHQGLRYEILLGDAIRAQLQPLAALRLTVFRDWPYLYDGTREYEERYLETYARSPQGLAMLAWERNQCVGATTALPMAQAPAEMRQPFEHDGEPIADLLYFGESVVLERHRGRGIGVAFFEHREAHARKLGLSRCTFCAVERPASHPLKPEDYVPNDAFWTRRGYARQPQWQCQFEWQDLQEPASTPHTLTYWLKSL
jgi:GNAT superfamily N-acetyltransferase